MEEKDFNTFTIVKLIPNMITMMALCFSLFSVKLSIIGKFEYAAFCIIGACLLDVIDGKVARKLNVASEFGAQIDSLADFFDFGIAPGFFVYFWKMQYYEYLKLISWLPVLFLAIGMAIRLARFNVDLGDDDQDNPLNKYFFKGCPAPMDALFVLFPFAVENTFTININPIVVIIITCLAAFFAVSRIPTFTPKKMKIKNEYKSIVLLSLSSLIIGIILDIWLTLVIFLTMYLLSIVFGWIFYFKLKNNIKKV